MDSTAATEEVLAEQTTDDDAQAADDDAQAAVDRAKKVGHLLDEAVRVPGTNYRIGIDPLLGIVPVSGDAVAVVASLYIVYQALQVGVPGRTIATMLLLIAVEFVIGSIPVLGTLLDAVVKVNKRNARVLESHVDAQSS